MVMDAAKLSELTLNYWLTDPQRAAMAFMAASDNHDEEQCRIIVAECKKRGIDVVKAVREEIERHDRLWAVLKNPRSKVSGGKELRSPLSYGR